MIQTNNIYTKRFLSYSRTSALIIIFICVLGLDLAFGQLELRRIPSPVKSKSSSIARTQADPIVLPFFDDFSQTPVMDENSRNGGRVLSNLWISDSSKGAYVNHGNAINPPSLNVVTLDGLNHLGLPYSEQLLDNGLADTLVSNPIDLSPISLPIGERPTVYLSFFYQWAGRGEQPDPRDYLQVEFKDAENVWTQVMAIRPDENIDKNVFYSALIQVQGESFFHSDFQFRFRNFGRLSGPFDAWNIDYVFLDKNRNSILVEDVTVTDRLSPLFGRYTAMPIEHFLESPQLTPIKSKLFNLHPINVAIGFDGFARFENHLENDTVSYTLSFPYQQIDDQVTDPLTEPLEHDGITLSILPDVSDPNQINPLAKRINITYEFRVLADPTTDAELPMFRANDTLRTTFRLDDYYAYDDGTAEYAAVLTNPGVRVAYAFDLLRTSEEPVALSGFDVYLPQFSVVPNLTVQFYVYDDEDGMPGEVLYATSPYSIPPAGINEFVTIPIHEKIAIRDRFYIGWEAPVGGFIAVGIDYNNNTGDKIFYLSNGTWKVNEDILGSLMIRPHIGDPIVSGIPEELTHVKTYPNPNTGIFYLSALVDDLELFTVTGQKVSISFNHEGDQTRVEMPNANPGLYLIRMRIKNAVKMQKVIVD
jgi:hypothetical protein